MNKAEIFNTVRANLMEVIPKLNEADIVPEKSMRELGANSIDRADVVIKSMSDLSLKIPLIELGKVSNIGELVDLFYAKLNSVS